MARTRAPATALATSSWAPGLWSTLSRPPRAVRRSSPHSCVVRRGRWGSTQGAQHLIKRDATACAAVLRGARKQGSHPRRSGPGRSVLAGHAVGLGRQRPTAAGGALWGASQQRRARPRSSAAIYGVGPRRSLDKGCPQALRSAGHARERWTRAAGSRGCRGHSPTCPEPSCGIASSRWDGSAIGGN